MDSLSGRVALVTGSSRGIGREVALALAAAGADVAVNFISREAEAQSVVKHIQQMQRRAACVQADVSSSEQVRILVEAVEAQLGSVDILVNNAGISRPQPVTEIAEQDWDDVIDVNLKSCFLVTQAVLPGMRSRKWGRIINLSSVAAHIGSVVGPHYAASKAGMLGLMHHYARSFVKEGITANAVSPALIETEMVTSIPNASPSLIPVGRYGLPAEVAEVVVMLAKDGYITGQTIHVNGGLYMT